MAGKNPVLRERVEDGRAQRQTGDVARSSLVEELVRGGVESAAGMTHDEQQALKEMALMDVGCAGMGEAGAYKGLVADHVASLCRGFLGDADAKVRSVNACV